MLSIFKRLSGDNKEEQYKVVPFIAEFWKTVSNLPFVILGSYNLYYANTKNLKVSYSLLTLAGFSSAFHHAINGECMFCNRKITWTLIVDWIPILASSVYVMTTGMYKSFSLSSWMFIGSSLTWLLIDNVFAPFKHWGHCAWHILIAFAIANAYHDCK